MQIYQDHVVFQSFSDLYYMEVRMDKQRQAQAAHKAALAINVASSSKHSQPHGSYSEQSSPASSRPPSLLFNDLSRTPSTKSTSSSSAASSQHEDDEAEQYYPAGLTNSSVQRRLREKEADLATLHDAPMFHSNVDANDLSLKRF